MNMALPGLETEAVRGDDVVLTPLDVARDVVSYFAPRGRVLDPCRGNGAFADLMPRWANKDDQARNKRTNRKVAIHGDEKCLAEACETTGVKYTTAHNRLNAGFSVESALENIDLRKRKPL